MTDSRSELTALARECADGLVDVCETAQRVARRTGNTFVLDRDRVATMIAGKFSRLAASQPQPDREMVARKLYEIQPVNDRCDENGDPIPWDALADFCKELHYSQADSILSLLSGEVVQKSDGPGVRQEDSALSHGESLQQGADTSSKPSTAEFPHGKGSDAAYVAKPPAASDRASHVAPGPSDPAPGPDVREALDREEKYLLDHFGADCDIMPGDIEGAFHRIREAAALSRPVGDVQKKLNSDGQHQTEQSGKQLSPAWQPIETAPRSRTILLFAVTDVAGDGTVRNWKMGSGFYHTGYESHDKLSPWCWEGRHLASWDVFPTRWRPLPAPPVAETDAVAPGDTGLVSGVSADPDPAPPAGGR